VRRFSASGSKAVLARRSRPSSGNSITSGERTGGGSALSSAGNRSSKGTTGRFVSNTDRFPQPTIAENIGFQVLVAGLVHGLCTADHPLSSLDRDIAERSFYAAVEDGIDAEMAWVTADGDRTTDPTVIYDELFEFARRGLREQGVSSATIEDYVGPIEARWTDRMTPSRWKLARVADYLDAGERFDDAVYEMQADYIRRAATDEPLVRWF